MGDRERTDMSDTRWCAGYPRATVHQVTLGNVPANEYDSGVTENARHSTNASQTPQYHRARDSTQTINKSNNK